MEGGRNRIVLYSHERSGRERAAARFEWAERIRRALAEDRFELFAQPIADARSGGVSQYELLLRMRDEDGTLIMPSAFMPTAERHGLVGAIDRWVVEHSIRLAADAERRGQPVRVEINLSGPSISDRATPDLIAALIKSAEIDPSLLVFEITETAAIDSLSQARDCAQRLRKLGCQFALDDFGAGFSSFVHLRSLPIDYVKIDGEFIRGLADNPSDRLFVQAIVTIVRGLGKQTIAEFVEDAEAADESRSSASTSFRASMSASRHRPRTDCRRTNRIPTVSETALTPDSIRGRWLRELWASSIGKKIVVAITGVILALYVVAHAAGNLKAFQGAGENAGGPSLDHYAEWLRTVGEPAIPRQGLLWTIRIVLILALILHVTAVIQLTKRNREARPAEAAPRSGSGARSPRGRC